MRNDQKFSNGAEMSKTSSLTKDKLAILAQAPQAKNLKMCYNLGSINWRLVLMNPRTFEGIVSL
jgi:hypothetical protein